MKQFDCLSDEITLLGHHFLEASAGTGKTFAIEHIALRMLLDGPAPLPFSLDEILIVTFTRAATRDLKKRVRSSLQSTIQALKNPHTSSPPYIKKIILQGEKSISSAIYHLEKAYALFDQAQIFTIHGFCHQMLSEFAFEAKLGFEGGKEDEMSYKKLLLEEIDDFFRTSLHKNEFGTHQLLSLLKQHRNDKQTLAKKICSLVEKDGIFPSLPNFQSSHEAFVSALQTLSPSPSFLEDFMEIAPSFTKLCSINRVPHDNYVKQIELLATYIKHKTCSMEDFDLLLNEDPFVLEFIEETNLRIKCKSLPEKAHYFFSLREKILPIIKEASSPTHTLLRIANEIRKKSDQVLELEEMTTPDEILKKMKENLKNPHFFQKVSHRYRGVIVDEFQDTDPLQWHIFETLFITSQVPAPALYLVGDPKQSIYSFRNADLPTYLRAAEKIGNISCLDTNHRSEPTLITILNDLFSEDRGLSYRPVHFPMNSADTPFFDDKKPVHFFIGEKKREKEKNWPSIEIEETLFYPFIANEIHSLVQNNPLTFRSCAILVKDRYQASRLKNFLEKEHIPTLAKSSDFLYSTLSYSLMISLIQAISTPSDLTAVKRALSHPLFTLTHHLFKEDSSFLNESMTTFHYFSHLFHTRGFYAMVDALLHHTWIDHKTLPILLLQSQELENYSDFMKLIELLIQEVSQNKASLLDLLHFLEGLQDQDEEENRIKRAPLTDGNSVTIMTIHMSKGLEFDVVFSLGLMNRPPEPRDLIQHEKEWVPYKEENEKCQASLQSQESEKIRQLYVALTRAKKRLYVAALIDLNTNRGKSLSPLELFFPENSELTTTLSRIGATYTLLREEMPPSLIQTKKAIPSLVQPTPLHISFPTQELHSFSSLAHHIPFKTSSEITKETLPPGTKTGNLIHTIFEKIIIEKLSSPFNLPIITDLIQSELRGSPLQGWEPIVTTIVEKAFHLPLAPTFSLKDVASSNLYPEVEFLYKSSPSSCIKGFADLIFFHHGCYYLLDWKSNLLEDYAEPALEQAMLNNDYYLQAEIYHTALKRYLTFKNDPHPIGGIFYIFLRGLLNNQGILFKSSM